MNCRGAGVLFHTTHHIYLGRQLNENISSWLVYQSLCAQLRLSFVTKLINGTFSLNVIVWRAVK